MPLAVEKTILIKAFCVERGRWGGGGENLRRAGGIGYGLCNSVAHYITAYEQILMWPTGWLPTLFPRMLRNKSRKLVKLRCLMFFV